ncbi:MAG: hypothetical protein ACR2GH_06680 [Pseudonocardia sp.]
MQALTELGHGRFRRVRREVSLELPKAADRPYGADLVLEEDKTAVGGVECTVEISTGETGGGEASYSDGLVAGDCSSATGLDRSRANSTARARKSEEWGAGKA